MERTLILIEKDECNDKELLELGLLNVKYLIEGKEKRLEEIVRQAPLEATHWSYGHNGLNLIYVHEGESTYFQVDYYRTKPI